ncbi:MAG TPA: polysaccharide pyruvyl transferase CsaB [Armatimonadota bacterium]|jgi:polysaccharide pyruvyl transferase CsaB
MDKRVLLSGYYGYGNAGDEAVCAAVLQTLRTHGGDPAVTVLSGDPAATERAHGAHAVPRRKILDALPEMDALFQGGGSLLQDATSAASTFYYLWVIMAARIIRRPVFLYAQGIGPLTRKPVRAAVRAVLNSVQAITVRDRDSKRLLTEIGVTRPPVYLTADPVWALDAAPPERAGLIWERQGLPSAGRTVAFALRAWPAAPDIAGVAARAAGMLAEQGLQPAFLPMQRPDDETLVHSIRAAMTEPAPWLQGAYAPGELLALAGRADLLAGMRLHALIFAASQGVPCLALAYDPKVSSLAAELGLPSLDVNGMTGESLAAAVGDAWSQREAIAARSAREVERLRDGAFSTARLARDFLEKHDRRV